MKQPWICWIVFVLIVGSILYELVTGTARVRGMGVYPRTVAPTGYWTVLTAKGALACLVAAMALMFGT